LLIVSLLFFSSHHTSTTAIYTLSLHDALPICLITDPGVVSAGSWAHVATTFNGGDWKIYVNGVVVKSTMSTVTSIFPGTANLLIDRKSTRLNSSHGSISYAVFCLKKNISIDLI